VLKARRRHKRQHLHTSLFCTLQVSRPPAALVANAYLEAQAHARAAPLVAVCLAYGATGEVPETMLIDVERRLT